MKKFFILLIILLTCSCTKINFQKSYSLEDNNVKINLKESLRVHFLDVGEGDSIFIELPSGECMLIDAGEKEYSTKIIEYIKSLQYEKLDYIIGTHPHADHIGGLSEIIKNYDVGTIYMPKVVATSKTYEELLNTIANKNLKIKNGKSGVIVLEEDNLKVSILAPNKDKYSGYNNYSIVVKITYGYTSYLFMGDAEALSEKEIKNDLTSDVLKVGHHGSDTSSSEEFLKNVNPKYAVISVGANNKYHHPSKEILEKLNKYTSNIYRTDINGNIIISSDGNNYNIELEKGEM